jgi:hypothetical protein
VRRSRYKNSVAVSKVLKAAEKSIWAAWEAGQIFEHTVLRGNARETPLGQFLARRLPSRYGVSIAAIESKRVCAIGMRSDLLDFSGENHFGSKLNRLPERALTEVIS